MRVGGHLVDPAVLDRLATDLRTSAEEARRTDPTDPGPPLAAVAHEHAVPLEVVVEAATRAGLDTTTGRLALPATSDLGPHEGAVRALEHRLAADPYDAPTRPELTDLGLDERVLAAAVRAGRLVLPRTWSSCPARSRRPSAGSPPSSSRGPSRRPGSPSSAGSRWRCAPTSTVAGSPAASPTTAAPSAPPDPTDCGKPTSEALLGAVRGGFSAMSR